jgi:nucleotide-binding universal stress UspA family protein
MKVILVPVDFSDVTPRLVEAATSIASATGGHIVLLNVMSPPHLAVRGAGETAGIVNDVKKHYLHLNELHHEIEKSGVSVTIDQPQGSPVETILKVSERESADMIVMGSHGHGALFELLAGSVTSGVLRSAKCPVLVVPSPTV